MSLVFYLLIIIIEVILLNLFGKMNMILMLNLRFIVL